MKNKTSENFSKSIDIYKRLRNKYAIVCNLFPRPFGERVRERGYLGASHINRLAAFTLAEGATHVARWNNSRKIAFTLAEVLITLGIIGIVAALTIPSVIEGYKEKETVAKLKKVYSVLSQSYELYMQETGEPFKWSADSSIYDRGEDEQYVEFFNILKKQYKKVKECHNEFVGCYSRGYYKTLLGNDYTYGYGERAGKGKLSLVTPDGVTIGFGWDGVWQQDKILVDLNGPKKPNRGGYDAFAFSIKDDKIIPFLKMDSENLINLCNLKNDGQRQAMNGWGCTGWVITRENLDYQKCIRGIKKYCDIDYSNYIGN